MGTLKKGESLPKNVILVGDTLTFLITRGGKRHKRSLGIELAGTAAERKEALALAAAKAREWRAEVLAGTFELRKREDAGRDTVADLLAAFARYAAGTTMAARTISDYEQVAKRVAAARFPGTPIASLPIGTFFHRDTLEAHREAKLKAARAAAEAAWSDRDPLYSARNAFSAEARMLKALWSESAMESAHYRALYYDADTIAAFKRFKLQTPAPKAFQPASAETRQKFTRLMGIAERHRPTYWLACVLTGVIGLRRGDAAAARWDFITDSQVDSLQPDGTYKRERAVFYAFSGSSDKRNKRGEIKARIPGGVYDRMLAVRKPGSGDYIIPLPTPRARLDLYQRIAGILQAIGVTDPKPNHWLRKWVGAIYATQGGLLDAATQLGNSDLKTIQQRYSAILNNSRAFSTI